MVKEEFLSDEFFMRQALIEARKAFDKDEVPVGAIVVANNTIIARAFNLTETLNDATAHAEMQVLTAASNYIGNKYLNDCCLYVSLEPCIMCAGALYWTQLGRLVYGAADPKRGYHLYAAPVLHPRTEIVSGILGTEAELLLKNFFSLKRKQGV